MTTTTTTTTTTMTMTMMDTTQGSPNRSRSRLHRDWLRARACIPLVRSALPPLTAAADFFSPTTLGTQHSPTCSYCRDTYVARRPPHACTCAPVRRPPRASLRRDGVPFLLALPPLRNSSVYGRTVGPTHAPITLDRQC